MTIMCLPILLLNLSKYLMVILPCDSVLGSTCGAQVNARGERVVPLTTATKSGVSGISCKLSFCS